MKQSRLETFHALQSSQSRFEAAVCSGGISAEPIYDMVIRNVLTRGCSGAALDYGAGTGRLAERLLQTGRFEQVYAADLVDYEAPVDPAIRWIRQDLNCPITGFDGAFDLVVAAELIEHLENPRATARELARLCTPSGIVIVTTPNNESIRSLLALSLRGHYVAFDDSCYPAHITALLAKDFERIFMEVGLEKPQFDYSGYGAVPKLTRYTWQQISGGTLKGRLFSDNVLALARKPA